MASLLPPLPQGVPPGHSYWNDWYEKLRAIIDNLSTGTAWALITGTPTTLAGYGITDAQSLDSDLTALASTATTGLYTVTGSGTSATRTLTAGSTKVAITNGSGVAGNPTVDVTEANLTLSNIGGTLSAAKGGTATTVPSGTYTPTLTNVANLDASTAYACQYIRINDVCTVSGKVDIDPTLAATSTQLGISLPIASNLGADEQCAGTAFSSGIVGMGAAIIGDAANNRAQMQWISSDTTNQPMYFTFTYRII